MEVVYFVSVEVGVDGVVYDVDLCFVVYCGLYDVY